MRARLRIVVACNEVRIRLSYLHGPPADDLKYHPDIRTPGEIAKQPQR